MLGGPSIGGPRGQPGRLPPDVVIVGAASRDVDARDPRGWRLGGGVSYGALLAARLGARVGAVVGLDRDAIAAHELTLLSDAGVELARVPLERGPVFENIETVHGRRQVAHADSDPLPPDAMPTGWEAAEAVLLAPVAGELADAWADVPAPASRVALAWQGVLRRLVPGSEVLLELPRARPLFRRADVHGASPEDLAAGDARLDELLPRVGQELALTIGHRGALHLRRTPDGFAVRRLPAVPAREVRDLTGAGDVFLTTWLVGLLRAGPFGAGPLAPGRVLRLAATVASLNVEGVGLPGLPDAAGLRRRLIELRADPVASGSRRQDPS